MGYENVMFLGGSEEYGVDIYFCKTEPTGKMIEYAAIVETREIHKQTGRKGVTHEILQHIKEALLHPVEISTPEYKEQRTVNMIWIITSKGITEPAKEYVRTEIQKELQFRNLQFFNGKDLLNWIDRYMPDLLRTRYFEAPAEFPVFWESDKYEILDKLKTGDPRARHELLGKDFVGENLQESIFEGVTMMGSSFVRSNLAKSNFMDASLMGADFSCACLFQANMMHASCMGTYFNGADMREVRLRGASLMGAYLRRATCIGADLRDAALMGAKLEGADLRKSNLEGAFFIESMLNDADLREAKVSNTDFTKADLEGADLRGVDFDDGTLKTLIKSYNLERAKFDPNVLESMRKLSEMVKKEENTHESSSEARELQVKCKTCGVWFSSGIAMSKRAFETSVLRANVHQCPKGHKHAYDKEDYRFKESKNQDPFP